MRINIYLGILIFLFTAQTHAGGNDDYKEARQRMISDIEQEVAETVIELGRPGLNKRVLEALKKVPRHEFVPKHRRKQAYQNRPLPIGHGQTISQPYIVAIMTDLLDVKSDDRVLEVGTGSGYQAAIMAELVNSVFSIEIIKPLGEKTKDRLAELQYKNIEVRIGDGYYGWKEQGPFDAIIVTAAASHIPPPLIKQLKSGGRMIIPVGSRFMVQELLIVEKDDAGKVTTRQILPVFFVPLTGRH